MYENVNLLDEGLFASNASEKNKDLIDRFKSFNDSFKVVIDDAPNYIGYFDGFQDPFQPLIEAFNKIDSNLFNRQYGNKEQENDRICIGAMNEILKTIGLKRIIKSINYKKYSNYVSGVTDYYVTKGGNKYGSPIKANQIFLKDPQYTFTFKNSHKQELLKWLDTDISSSMFSFKKPGDKIKGIIENKAHGNPCIGDLIQIMRTDILAAAMQVHHNKFDLALEVAKAALNGQSKVETDTEVLGYSESTLYESVTSLPND